MQHSMLNLRPDLVHHRSQPALRPHRVAVLALLLFFLPLLPTPAFAHGALRSATPGEGDQLSAAPRELRLTFTEAVEIAVSRLRLTGPAGPVALGPLAVSPDPANVLFGAIEGPLAAGTYTVNWQAVGADGHPVRGEYSFAIASGAQGLTTADPAAAAPVVAPSPASVDAGAADPPGSSTWVWLLTLVALGALGWAAFRLFAGRRRADAG